MDPEVRCCRAAASALLKLPSTLKLHYLLADPRYSIIEIAGLKSEDFVERTPCKTKSMTRLFGAGHCLVQERPAEAGIDIATVLDRWYGQPTTKL
jgi:hypothetical protein